MKQTFTFLRFRNLCILNLLLLIGLILNAQTVVWQEDFEGDWTNDWHVDYGTWDAGIPTSGPGSSFEGNNCAATNLSGNYTEEIATRLIRHTSILIPQASENPRLRFWHWFSIAIEDAGYVQIRRVGETDWTTLENGSFSAGSGNTLHSCSKWTRPMFVLSDYAGESIELAFYFTSHNSYHTADISAGWYIDEIRIETGDFVFNNPENWESGIDNWYTDRGIWEIGEPSSGPGSAHDGTNCAGTILDGSYSDYLHSRLISSEFIVPELSENPRLRFWHWFSIAIEDLGYVQIRTSENSEWTTLNGGNFSAGNSHTLHSCSKWTRPLLDLSEYAGQTVQLSFYFYSNNTYHTTNTSTGWYIDDIMIETGDYVFNNPEDWESGIDDWYTDRGIWEVGLPTSGPESANNGTNCAGTILDGNYSDYLYSRLISPIITIPTTTANPALRFNHWYNFNIEDFGYVQIRVLGENNWENLDEYSGYVGNGGWTPLTWISLIDYAEQDVQLSFYFYSNNTYHTTDVSSGWYIDDITITGIPTNIDKSQHVANESFILQNSPNPFTSSTEIKYSLEKTGLVSLEIYNCSGVKIKSLVNAVQSTGDYSISLDASDLSSGMYFYSLQVDNKTIATKKMVVVK
ncbi:T9SS type A sorting domain-containing protein [Saccharicrinis sp. 156]|uniref:T9SS type A sorting domain-containing protein n=1 Tax=Saccharicrinis sp. 156 TaxID=3417574 RepID=UPI003D33EBC9